MASQSIKFPIVHELVSDDIDSEGLGAVQNPISVTVTSNYDQFPELDLTALWSARNKELLQEDHILIVDAGDGWLKQMFRIVTCEDDWANDQRQILVTAFHIAFDASGNVLLNDVNVANATPQQVWAQLVDALAEPVDITVASSIKDIANVNWDSTQIDSVNSLLFGRNVADQTLTALYDAEWWFDNNQWTLEHHVGRDTGIVIKYGKQLKSLQNTNDFSSIYTAVRPISKYTPGQSGSNGTPQDISGIGLIQYAGTGGVPVYDNPYKGQVATGKLLQNGTRFKISSTVTEGTADGNTWYKVGANQWIDGEYLSFDKGQTSQFPTTVGNKATGKGTIATGLTDQPGVVETYTGVLTINYVGPGKVAVWNSPWNNKKVTGEYMKTGSSYKVFAKATDMNGKTWYELGTNQWVDSQYVALDKKKDYAYTKTRGAGTVKVDSGKVALWSAPSYNGHIIRYLANKTRWQIYGIATGGDSTWYNLGTNQWIDGQYMDFSSAKDVQPKTDDDSSSASESTVDTIYSFNAPGLWNTHVKSYKSGDKVTIYGEGTAGGTTWYNIGTDEWIESDFVTFTNPDDVDPSGSASDTSDQTVTVTLPEKYITVPMPNGKQYEHQRIANFDASSYGINNVDDLRSITQAYIADNNIGKPNFTLTIDYADMAKHYKNLLNVRLYDVVTVFIPEIDLTMKAEVSAVTYDVLLGQNQSVTIGNRPETQSDQLAQWQKDTSDTADQASTTANVASTLASQASDTADAATNTANASAKKIDTVSAQVNAAVAQAQADSKQAVADANNAVNTGNKALAQSQTAIDSANKTADDVVATNNNVKQTQSDLQDARTALQSSIADAKANISQAQTDINSMKQDISQNEADLGSAKDDITSAQASISDAQKDITAIKSSVSQNAQDIATAQGDISDLTTDKSTMSDDIQQIRTNLSTLSKNLNLIGQSITWTTIAVSASAPLDANTYTKQGYYFFNGDTTTSYVKNLPSGMTPYLYLMVQNAAGNVMQEAYKDTSPDRYERVYNASTKTWSQWQKVATESDITDLQGDISMLKQTANGLQTTVAGNSGDISTLKQTAKQNSTAIADNAGNITALQQSATQLKSEVADNTGDISALKQSSTQLSSTIESMGKYAPNLVSTSMLGWGNETSFGITYKADTATGLLSMTGTSTGSGDVWGLIVPPGDLKAGTFGPGKYTVQCCPVSGSFPAHFKIRFALWSNGTWKQNIDSAEGSNTLTFTVPNGFYVRDTGIFPTVTGAVADFTFKLKVSIWQDPSIPPDMTWVPNTADMATEQSVSALSQRADSIQSSVSTNTGDISALKQTANGLQTTVAGNSGDISTLKQTSSQLKSELADNANNISQVSQKADSISTTVESVTQEINNIGKYAPNLLLGTSNLLQTRSDSSWGSGNLASSVFQPQAGQKYTFRIYIDSPEADARAVFYLWDSSDNQTSESGNIVPAGQSGYSTVTFTVPNGWKPRAENCSGATVSFVQDQGSTLRAYGYKEMKLAIWQDPSIPPDMTWVASNADKADVNDVRSQFTQLSNQIGTKVSSTDFESRVTQIDQAIQSKVSSTEYQSEVTQLSNELNSKITGGGDVTNIVQNPYFNGGSTKGWSTNITSSTGNTKPGVPYYGHQSSRDAYYGTWFSVAPGETYFFQIFAWPDQSTRQFGIGLAFQNSDNKMTWQQAITYQTTDSGLKSGTLVVPDGYTQAMVWTFINANDTFGDWYFTRVAVSKSAPAGEVYSQIQQLNNNINLRVKAGDLINQINLSPDGITIDGNKLHITSKTSIDNAVITSAMIKSINANQIVGSTIDAKTYFRSYSGADSDHPGGNTVISAPGGISADGSTLGPYEGGISTVSSDQTQKSWLHPGGLSITANKGASGVVASSIGSLDIEASSTNGGLTVNGAGAYFSNGITLGDAGRHHIYDSGSKAYIDYDRVKGKWKFHDQFGTRYFSEGGEAAN